jgi:hypothetical protein
MRQCQGCNVANVRIRDSWRTENEMRIMCDEGVHFGRTVVSVVVSFEPKVVNVGVDDPVMNLCICSG